MPQTWVRIVVRNSLIALMSFTSFGIFIKQFQLFSVSVFSFCNFSAPILKPFFF